MHNGERWSRQRRSYMTVHPPYAALDTVAIRKDKSRFLESLWIAQCKARKARGMVSAEFDVNNDRVRCYWSLFTHAPKPPVRPPHRTSSFQGKVTILVQEQASEHADGSIILTPMLGGTVRMSCRIDDAVSEEVMDVALVAERIAMLGKLLLRALLKVSAQLWHLSHQIQHSFRAKHPFFLSPHAPIHAQPRRHLAQPVWQRFLP